MYIIAIVVGGLFVFLLIKSSKTEPLTGRTGIWKPLDRMSLYAVNLYRNTKKRILKNSKFNGTDLDSGNHVVNSCLEQLHPGEEVSKLKNSYIVQKTSLSILIVIIGTLIGVFVKYQSQQNAEVFDSNGEIVREDYYGNKKEMSVQAFIDDSDRTINLVIHPRKLTDEELEILRPEFRMKLEEKLLEGNLSSEHVNSRINTVTRIDGYPFVIRWSTSDYGLVTPSSGVVNEVEEPCQIFMTAHIKYENTTWDEEYVLTLVPSDCIVDEEIGAALEKELIRNEELTREDEILVLPTEYEGKNVTWVSVIQDNSIYIWIAIIVVAAVVFYFSDKDLEKKVEEKKTQKKREYSEIVRKIALYVGAGMTVRASFQKIAGDAVEKVDVNPIYQDMIFTCRELKSGISEEEAYERFGRRTGVQKYIQLSTLLQQNIKRGSANLLGRLREEADNAAIERLQACRKRGEEASTKLLIPMVLMLLVVMVIIMIPAFSSMSL